MRGSRGPLDRRQPSGEAETITQHQIQRTEMEGCTAARGHRGEDGEGGRERASVGEKEGGVAVEQKSAAEEKVEDVTRRRAQVGLKTERRKGR